MSRTRVYVATTWTGLRRIVAEQGLLTPPIPAHAVTDALRAGYPEGTEDDWEYAALSAASLTCLDLLEEGEPRRRVVVALDVASVAPGEETDPTSVVLTAPVPFRAVAAVLVDDEAAADDLVTALADRGPRSTERLLAHDLAWFATQEVEALARTWPG